MTFIFEQVKSNCNTWNYINLFYYNKYFREGGEGVVEVDGEGGNDGERREWWSMMKGGKEGVVE